MEERNVPGRAERFSRDGVKGRQQGRMGQNGLGRGLSDRDGMTTERPQGSLYRTVPLRPLQQQLADRPGAGLALSLWDSRTVRSHQATRIMGIA